MSDISEAFALIVDLAIVRGAKTPLRDHYAACWESDVDDTWRVSFNGHSEPRMSSTGAKVPGFEVFVEYNGWPAGLIGPAGGVIAAGAGANEDALIAALRAAIDREKSA